MFKNTNRSYTIDADGKVSEGSLGIIYTSVGDISDSIDGLPSKKTAEELRNYILIYTKEQLQDVAKGTANYQITDLNAVSKGTYTMASGAKYTLMNDIDLNGASITSIVGFTGEFEGNGCKVISINSSVSYDAGILNYAKKSITISNCSIQNVNVKKGEILGTTEDPSASSTANIINCTAKGVTLTYSNGGIILYSSATKNINIENCKVEDTIFSGNVSMSGLAYMLEGKDATIKNCTIKGSTFQTGGYTFAGLLYLKTNPEGKLKVENCNFSTQVGFLAGIVPPRGVDYMKVENCSVKQTYLKGRNVYKIAGGYNANNCTETNCTVVKE